MQAKSRAGLAPTASPGLVQRFLKRDSDRRLGALLAGLAAACATLLLLVLAFLLVESLPVLAHWRAFFSSEGWYPLENRFDLMPMLWASLAAATGALLLAAPLGLASAIFVVFYAPAPLARFYRLVLNLLAGIPSVVFGLWGLTVLVPLIARWQPPGASLLAAVLILALMILPTVAVTAIAALRAVPRAVLSGAVALGIGARGRILGVALPAARGGITGGFLLAAARALGETMAVLMVAGNVVQNPSGLFEPVRVLTANIALEMAYATGTHRSGLFASGLVLTLLVLLLAWLGTRVMRGHRHG
ncbi:phosphate ABC transporter permease subunit PstC [Microbulbifer rhizosphaerae]|uniref:Phosphate transport system permease protein n=1 Tax=Microbulbifer rhizosphaerae TaxID=1562603 RepID=A0A7W4W9Y3_9GAMM|nr:phosphate ABC transporter permease subunit PstC [Microbulbifer rhizosphaerae]MBB3059917.1 phosphate transport system permease protein [Microbulbifer rhizosphaerae]